MRNTVEQEQAESDLPYIDPAVFYDTKGAASVLGLSEGQLRQWRHRNVGPKYQQTTEGGRCQYLGAWLIQFRRTIIVDPTMAGAAR